MTEQELQAIEEQYGKLVRFFDITKNELDGMVAWNPDTPVAEFWEMFDAARMGLEDTQRLLAEVRALRAKLDAVPVQAIRKVRNAAENDGYMNDDVDEWLGELESEASI
jgi:hypothetical protein